LAGLLSRCALCPRRCEADRENGAVGLCGAEGAAIKAGRAMLHRWEEPCISGRRGSGALFFSGCSMRCVFCQNHEISRENIGKAISSDRLAEIFLELQNAGAHNINLVTATQYAPQIAEAMRGAKMNGLALPTVWNSSGYERPETVELISEYVDVYMPDFKYMNDRIAERYSGVSDYSEYAVQSLRVMAEKAGRPVFDTEGMMTRGVLVRHMTLPGCVEDSKRILRYLHTEYGDDILISIMNQYTPPQDKVFRTRYPSISKSVSADDYDELVDFALMLGIKNGYIQEGGTISESFVPKFDGEGI